jgi:hypothetical protein
MKDLLCICQRVVNIIVCLAEELAERKILPLLLIPIRVSNGTLAAGKHKSREISDFQQQIIGQSLNLLAQLFTQEYRAHNKTFKTERDAL